MDRLSPPEAKIALFRSLFRGREDVYPLRFESKKSGKKGYQPACATQWVKGVCDKGRIKCGDCTHRRWLAVTDEVIRHHLSGRDESGNPFVLGLYPMLPDESCLLLVIDFDKASWQADTAAFLQTCHRLEVPAALERSRSGNGGHIWLFFAEPLPAAMARALASCLITETMEQRPDLGLDSYDRLIPGQDTMPKGGLGSLIALPLQKLPRERGNSCFVDDHLLPFADQWAFLNTITKIERCQAEAIIRSAEAKGRVLGVRRPPMDEDDPAPWSAPPSRRRRERPITGLPTHLELVLADQIYLAKEGLPPGLHNRLLRLAAFQNPEFYKAQALRLPTFGIPRIIACAEEYPQHLALPRGCLEDVEELLAGLKVRTTALDQRCPGVPLPLAFRGELRPEQQAAAHALAAHDTGVLAATTAFGKTVIAAWLIAQRGVNTLVVVHRRQLQEQWVERLSSFLGIPAKEIGRIGGGGKGATGGMDVATIQTLVRKGVVDDRLADYGHLVVDECHHLSAASFELVARRAKARYVTGLSATVVRKDGHQPIIFMQCGPVRYRVEPKKQALARPFNHAVLVRPTGFQSRLEPDPDRRTHFQALYRELMADEARNRLICADVVAAVRLGRSPVVLTERTEHLEQLTTDLAPHVRHLLVLQGGMGKKRLKAALDRLTAVPAHEERLLLATGGYLGEGFDDPRLDTLFLVLPVSWRGTIAQYAGRLHRLHAGKHEVQIHDYADLNVPMLARMFERRCQGYEAIGYTVHLPASALPGWPSEVALPTDPQWKEEYAASLRRLLRDGVDAPLAELFRRTTHPFAADAVGTDRARSASEAFLFRRLETMAQTAGRFRLNALIPIPFDGQGRMEVDLLDDASRVAIEVDGCQHLGDRQAYRRDRGKDQLLQENGYLVLRFLAEDIGTRLDHVLDAIQRSLVHRQGS